jgi:AraC-like DNA-binding protein
MAGTAIHFSVASADAPDQRVDRRMGDPGGDWSIFVLNGHGRRFWTRSAGAFSLKWMARGLARYALERRPNFVARDRAVLVDQDQPYEMEFDAPGGGESFCLFYSRPLVAEAWASIETGFSPLAEAGRLPGFPNVTFQPSPDLANLLSGLHANGPDACEVQIEARLLLALSAAVETAHRHRRLEPRLPAVKPATRAHVLGLLERARAMILETDGVGISLQGLAEAVGLSRFHLLRLFKAVYGSTPLGFAERTRMEVAARRLSADRHAIGELSAALGYDSPSAFARAFRRRFGHAPARHAN